MRQPSAMPADDRDSGAAQLLGNGRKIEPYTIIIMLSTLHITELVTKKLSNECDITAALAHDLGIHKQVHLDSLVLNIVVSGCLG
jgi:hypothetical protein